MEVDERGVADADTMQVLHAIAASVRPKGRVELLACSAGATPAGKAFLSKLATMCGGTQFAAREAKAMMPGASRGLASPSRLPVADTLASTHAQAHSRGAAVGHFNPSAGKSTPVVEPPM